MVNGDSLSNERGVLVKVATFDKSTLNAGMRTELARLPEAHARPRDTPQRTTQPSACYCVRLLCENVHSNLEEPPLLVASTTIHRHSTRGVTAFYVLCLSRLSMWNVMFGPDDEIDGELICGSRWLDICQILFSEDFEADGTRRHVAYALFFVSRISIFVIEVTGFCRI